MAGIKDVYEIADTIRQVSNPDAIILFGSIADKGEGYDIDLLIVSNSKEEARIKDSLKPFYRRHAIDAFTVSKGRLRELYFRGACYSCRQALEKIIKWALLKKGWELEKTHSIRRLMAIAGDYGIKIRLKDEEIDFIDSIYKGRYPAEEGLLPLGVPTKRDARKALGIAHKVFKQVQVSE